MKIKGYIYITLAACLWGILGPVSRFAFAEGLAPLEVAFWRAVLAWGCFGIHAVMIKQVRIARQDLVTIPIFGITGVAMFYGVYQLAVRSSGAALASVLLYTAPAWVTLMAAVLFREKITWAKCTALLLTLLGVTGVSLASGDNQAYSDLNITASGIVFGLLSGFCYSLYYIFGKHFSGRYSAPNLFFYILPIGAASLFPFVTFVEKTPAAWIALFTIAVISTYAAYFCYYIGLQYLEASRASIIATIEPVVAAVVAFFWWKEYFGWTGYVGSALILVAVVMMVYEPVADNQTDPIGKTP